MWTEGGFDQKGCGVRISQSSVKQDFVDAIQMLLDKVVPEHKHYTRERTHQSRKETRGLYKYTEHCWFFSGEIAKKVREDLPKKHLSWGLVWKMTQEEKRAFMWAAIRGDGQIKRKVSPVSGKSGAENYTFYQKDREDLNIFQSLCHLTAKQGRIDEKKGAVCIHNNPTTQLQSRHLMSSTHFNYEGLVWCVRVPTGAFVARRKGLIFITGNSGFPKNFDIARAIDKKLGVKRTAKIVPFTGNALMRHGGDNTRPWMEEALKKGFHEMPGDEAVSDEARKWKGWGTALKPAWEPVLIARKIV